MNSQHCIEQWNIFHSKCMEHNCAGAVKLIDGSELHICPLKFNDEKPGEGRPFLAYRLSSTALQRAQPAFENTSLITLFDLDGTLLVSHFQVDVDDRLVCVRKSIRELGRQGASVEQRARLEREERSLLEEDRRLKQYIAEDAVTVGTTTHSAQLETSTTTEFGTVTRNVVRLPGDKVIFSRVDPTRPETSFVYRGRPGFKQLSAFLAEPTGMAGKPRRRAQAYIATAAERQYALEAWRLLDSDPQAPLIPRDQVEARMVCDGHKSVAKALRLGDWSADDVAGSSVMPIAVALDDRTKVWALKDQKQVIKVGLYKPLEIPETLPADISKEELDDWEAEELGTKIKSQLTTFRRRFYNRMGQVASETQDLRSGQLVSGAEWLEKSKACLKPLPSAASLLRELESGAVPGPPPSESGFSVASVFSRGRTAMALGGMGLGGGPVSNGAAAGEEVVAPWEKIPGPPVVPIFARQTKLDRKEVDVKAALEADLTTLCKSENPGIRELLAIQLRRPIHIQMLVFMKPVEVFLPKFQMMLENVRLFLSETYDNGRALSDKQIDFKKDLY